MIKKREEGEKRAKGQKELKKKKKSKLNWFGDLNLIRRNQKLK